MSVAILIEEHTESGVDWLVSFDGSNPTTDKCIKCADRTEAEKLISLIEQVVKPPRRRLVTAPIEVSADLIKSLGRCY